MKKERLYPLYSLLLLLLGAPVLAALAAPWVYRWLQSFAPDGSVLDAPFHRVTARIVLVVILAFLFPAYRISGMHSRNDLGLVKSPRWKSLIGLGLALGIGSMLIVYLLGTVLGVYVWDAGDETASYLIRKIIQILIGGLFIGVSEEILFRGFIFGALRKSLGVVAAVLIGSFLFSMVHFMRPTDPETVNRWYSGFLLLGNLFARAGSSFPQEASTLFCMGLVLSVLCYWTKSVYVAIEIGRAHV